MPKRMKQVPGELFHVERTPDEIVCARRSFYRQKEHIDIRIYRPSATGEWKRTSAGITVPVGVVGQLARELAGVAAEPPLAA